MEEKKKPAPRIHDVDVNRDALKKAGSIDEFKKLNPNIFDHLGDKETVAYAELWAELNPPANKPALSVGQEAKP